MHYTDHFSGRSLGESPKIRSEDFPSGATVGVQSSAVQFPGQCRPERPWCLVVRSGRVSALPLRLGDLGRRRRRGRFLYIRRGKEGSGPAGIWRKGCVDILARCELLWQALWSRLARAARSLMRRTAAFGKVHGCLFQASAFLKSRVAAFLPQQVFMPHDRAARACSSSGFPGGGFLREVVSGGCCRCLGLVT
jgi:hypothetical protein